MLHRRARFAGRRRTGDQEIQVPTISGGTGSLVAGLLLRFPAQLRNQLGPHLLEFLALAGLQDLENPAQASGTQIVELILQALVIVTVILEHHGDLIGLLGGKVQFGFEILEHGIVAGFPGRRGGGYAMEPVVQSIFHSQHPDGGPGQKHQEQRGGDARIPDGRTIAHDR